MVLYLLDCIQVNRVVVGAELLSFEEVDSGLIQLEDDNFVKQVETFDIPVSSRDCLRKRSDLVDLAFLRAEEGLDRVLAILHRANLLHISISLLALGDLALLHL